MTQTVKLKLETLVPTIYNYLKTNRPNGGVADMATIGAQVINYLVYNNTISLSEKDECKQYLCHLIGYAFRKGLPDSVSRELYNLMIDETGYNDIARKIANQI
jgi:hypothetical protein